MQLFLPEGVLALPFRKIKILCFSVKKLLYLSGLYIKFSVFMGRIVFVIIVLIVVPNIAPADPENSVRADCDVVDLLDRVNVVD